MPAFDQIEKLDLLNFKTKSPIMAAKRLMEKHQVSHADSKFIVAHINTEYGQCNRCDYEGLIGEYVECPTCKSFNFNWE